MAIIGFDTTVFPKLDYKNPRKFWKQIKELERFFSNHKEDLSQVIENVPALRAAFDKLDPLIQSYTAKVCPYCGTVCCANKFGFPEFADVVCFLAMDLDIPRYDLDVDEEAICQFIGEKGCVLPRIQRPYRCTWYFCDPLLVQLEIGPARHYRSFVADLQELSMARGKLLEAFYTIWTKGNNSKQ